MGDTMAEVTARRGGEMQRGLFTILAKEPDGLPAKEALARLAVTVPPTPFEAADYPKHPGVRRYERLVRFRTIGPVKAGWLVKEDGVWSVTEAGMAAYKEFPDPEDFYREQRRLYKVWHAEHADAGDDADDAEMVVPEPTGQSVEEATEQAWDEVREYLLNMSPYDFQHLVAALLEGMGYHVSWVAPAGPDDGIDVIAYSDPLGATGPRIKVQVKRYASKVDVGDLRSFIAIVGDDEIGIFVAASGFTREAERTGRRESKRKVTLLDAADLYRLWVEYQKDIPEESRSLLPLTPVHYLDLSQ